MKESEVQQTDWSQSSQILQLLQNTKTKIEQQESLIKTLSEQRNSLQESSSELLQTLQRQTLRIEELSSENQELKSLVRDIRKELHEKSDQIVLLYESDKELERAKAIREKYETKLAQERLARDQEAARRK